MDDFKLGLVAFIKTFTYTVKHIWYVRRACWANGLYWQGLVHDWTKFLPSEFIPYMNFFGRGEVKRNATGYYKPTDTGNAAFEAAWFLHQKRNPHHWQYWVLPVDDGGLKLLPMPHKYRLEMLCDWWGASMAQGYKGKCRTWYETNKHRMQLHPETREWVGANVSDVGYGVA